MIESSRELYMVNVLSKRIKILQSEVYIQIEDIKKICDSNFFIVKSMATVTHGIEKTEKGTELDLEIIIELQNRIEDIQIPEGLLVKEKIYITNALYKHYEGSSIGSNTAYNEIKEFLIKNKLQAITPAYSVSKHPFSQSETQMNLDIYVGINPNIM